MAEYSVDGTGQMFVGNEASEAGTDGGQALQDLDLRYQEISFGVNWEITGSGGTLDPSLRYRNDGGAYYSVDLTIDIATDTVTGVSLTDTGTPIVSEVLSIPHAGVPVNVRVQSTTSQKVKIWSSAGVEPDDWDIDIVEDDLPAGYPSLMTFSDLIGSPVTGTSKSLSVVGFEIFDWGDLTGHTGATNDKYIASAVNSTIVSGVGRNGGAACRVSTVVSNGGITIANSGGSRQCSGVMYVYFENALPTASCEIAQFTFTGGARRGFDFDFATSRLVLEGTNGPVLSPNRWTRIEFAVTSATPGTTLTMDWRVDGVAFPQVVGSTGSAGANITAGPILGPVAGGVPTVSMLWDDIGYIESATAAASYPFGDLSVQRLEVDPTGTITQSAANNAVCRFQNNGGTLDVTFNATDIMNALDQYPYVAGPGSEGAYGRLTTNAIRVPMKTITLSTDQYIYGVRGIIPCWGNQPVTGTGNNSFNLLGSVDGWGSQTTIIGASQDQVNNGPLARVYANGYTPTGGWNQSKLDLLELGYSSSDSAPLPGIYTIMAEVGIHTEPAYALISFDDFQCYACTEDVG